jgi:uncharacterized protein YdgA (DUF945 family)
MDGTGIYEGTGYYGIDQVTFKEGMNFFQMDKIEITGSSSVNDETTLDVDMTTKIEALSVAGESFTNNRMTLEFKGLDIATLQEFAKLSQRMQDAMLAGQDVSAYNMQMMNLMTTMLTKGPSVHMSDTSVTTPQGDITAKLDFVVDGNKMDPNNPMAIMTAMSGQFDAEAPEEFFAIRGMAPMLEQWQQMNFIVRENGKVKVNATYQDGMPMINGQPMQGIPM